MDKQDRCPFRSDHSNISEFDMLDPHARSCPHSYYKWLQQDFGRRVYKAPHEDSFYVVHAYDDVKLVLTNSKLFSSAILPTKRSPFLALMDGENHLRQREVATTIFQVDHPDFPREGIKNFIRESTKVLVAGGHGDLLKQWATPIPLASLCLIFGVHPTEKMTRQLHEHAIIINRALFVLGGTGPAQECNANFSGETFDLVFAVEKCFKNPKT